MKQTIFLASLFIFLAAFTGCTPDETITTPADVQVNIKTFVKNEQAVEGVIKYPTDAGPTFSLLKLRYFITRINLVKDDGTIVELKKAHLYFNQKDEETNSFTSTDIPAGHYKAMTFNFGFAKADNQVDFLPNTLQHNMGWPTMFGTDAFHYMQFEGRYKIAGSTDEKNFAFHLGPTNDVDYSFSTNHTIDMTIDGTKKNITIKMDLNEWFHGSTNWDLDAWGGIMGNPEAQAIAKANGENTVFSVSVD